VTASRLKTSLKLGASLGKLGFSPSPQRCENCGKRAVFRRESTGEFWCARCKWGSLYEGTKQREEFGGYFAAGVIRDGEWQER